jgi:hypothetical protein
MFSRAALVILVSLLSPCAMAGQSVAVKQPPTAFDLCVVQANAQLTSLTDENKKLMARVAALEQQLAARDKLSTSQKIGGRVGKHLPCKAGRTRNAEGQCGRWGRKFGFGL